MAIEDLIPILAPAFVDDPRMPAAIALADTQVAPDHCYHDQVVVLTAAHFLTVADRGAEYGGVGGNVVSMSEGGLSLSFGNNGALAGSLGSTSYGTEIDRLNRLCYGMSARTAWIS